MMNIIKKIGVFLASVTLSGTFAIGSSNPVFAATNTSSVQSNPSITGGNMTITAPTVQLDFPATTLNGHVQQIYATLNNWSWTNALGTGSAYKITVQATQLTEIAPSGGFATGTSAYKLPLGSLALAGTRTITPEAGSTPVDSTNGPLLQNQTAAIDASSPVSFVQTNQNFGMGTYTVTEPSNGLDLTLSPSTTYVDKTNYPSSATPYQTVITYTIMTTP